MSIRSSDACAILPDLRRDSGCAPFLGLFLIIDYYGYFPLWQRPVDEVTDARANLIGSEGMSAAVWCLKMGAINYDDSQRLRLKAPARQPATQAATRVLAAGGEADQ
jgi:hypothetical protein